jgi:chromosome segregation ATPase
MPDDRKEPKEYFVNRLSEQVSEMEEEISELEVRLEDSGWEPELDYEKQIDEMKIALREARERLSELESSGWKGWPTMYKETDASLGDLLTRIQTLREVMDRFLPE